MKSKPAAAQSTATSLFHGYGIKPPSKEEDCLQHLIERQEINTFTAHKAYGDTCLHSTISLIQKRYHLNISRELKPVVNRYGQQRYFAHYSLSQTEKIKAVLLRLKLSSNRFIVPTDKGGAK